MLRGIYNVQQTFGTKMPGRAGLQPKPTAANVVLERPEGVGRLVCVVQQRPVPVVVQPHLLELHQLQCGDLLEDRPHGLLLLRLRPLPAILRQRVLH